MMGGYRTNKTTQELHRSGRPSGNPEKSSQIRHKEPAENFCQGYLHQGKNIPETPRALQSWRNIKGPSLWLKQRRYRRKGLVAFLRPLPRGLIGGFSCQPAIRPDPFKNQIGDCFDEGLSIWNVINRASGHGINLAKVLIRWQIAYQRRIDFVFSKQSSKLLQFNNRIIFEVRECSGWLF